MSALMYLPHHIVGIVGLICIAAAVWRLRVWIDRRESRPVRSVKGAKVSLKMKRK